MKTPLLSFPRSSFPLLLSGIALLGCFAPQAHAALLWYADFENYTSGSSVTFNGTGANNTFSALINEGTNAVTTATVKSATGGMTSNFMTLARVSSDAGSGFSGFTQDKIASIADGGTAVLSFDLNKQVGETAVNLQTKGLSTNGSGNEAAANLPSSSGVIRMTLVVNRSGSSLILPGTLGSLADDAVAIYLQSSAGAYFGLTTSSISAAGSLTGFASRSFMTDGRAVGFDNFGFWSSTSDTWNGTNVMQLAAGTVVPEPSTAALAGLGVFGFLAIFRRRCALRLVA